MSGLSFVVFSLTLAVVIFNTEGGHDDWAKAKHVDKRNERDQEKRKRSPIIVGGMDYSIVTKPKDKELKERVTWMRGGVFYQIEGTLEEKTIAKIKDAMKKIEQAVNVEGSAKKCIEFINFNKEIEPPTLIIKVRYDKKTFSIKESGTRGSKIFTLTLGFESLRESVIIQQLLYIIGLRYEHLKKGRDSYIVFDDDNINFGVFPEYGYSLGYYNHYHSIMHAFPYDQANFADKPSITPKHTIKVNETIGSYEMTAWDAKSVRELYDCQPKKFHFHSPYGRKLFYCQFEKKLCGMTGNWHINKGPRTEFRGPQAGFSTGLDHFLVGFAIWQPVTMATPALESGHTVCIRFQMFQNPQDSLKVFVQAADKSIGMKPMLIRETTYMPLLMWVRQTITVTPWYDFKVIFESSAEVALDELSIVEGACPEEL